jgi:hypothetical protein
MPSLLLAPTGLFAHTDAYFVSITGLSLLGGHFRVSRSQRNVWLCCRRRVNSGSYDCSAAREQGNQIAVIEAGEFYEMENWNE